MSAAGEPGRWQLFAYALPALPLAVLTLPLYILVPSFYAESLGLPLAAVGAALLLVRLVDALGDPLAGVLADRWRPRFGRRRLWFVVASVPTAFAAYFVFSPPAQAGIGYLAVWGSVLSVAWTAALVPYTAWGAELSTSYAGRARVAAWRETFAVAGTLVALSAQAVAPLLGFPGQANVLRALGVLASIGIPFAAFVCVTMVPEPRDATRLRVPFVAGLGALARNRPFLRLLLAFFLNGFANGLPASLFLFFVGDRLKAVSQAGPLLFVYFLCGIMGVPLWLRLGQKWSKHRAWSAGMVMACLFFAAAPLLGPGDVLAFGVVCVGTGLALGADLLLPPSIQADVIDIDTAATGAQRAGLYFAIWGFATKLALAVAVGVAFPLLAYSGYDPATGLASAGGLQMLGVLYAGVPIALKVLAVALVWNFPVDAASHARLRAEIEGAASTPL